MIQLHLQHTSQYSVVAREIVQFLVNQWFFDSTVLFSSILATEREAFHVLMMQPSWKLLFILEFCLAVCSGGSVEASSSAPHTVDFPFKHDPGWLGWKAEHTKSYESDIHELEKYVTWVSNTALIDAHNALRSSFGYTLAMNQFGDLVRNNFSNFLL